MGFLKSTSPPHFAPSKPCLSDLSVFRGGDSESRFFREESGQNPCFVEAWSVETAKEPKAKKAGKAASKRFNSCIERPWRIKL